MNIDSITNGYVIDHIPSGNAMKIYNYLKLDKIDCQVALITKAKSKKMKKKDIIKIDKLIDLDYDTLGFLVPNGTVNIVKDDKIVDKKKLALPEVATNVVKCNNPRCITSIEKNLDNIFILTDKENVIYRCKYCESRLYNK